MQIKFKLGDSEITAAGASVSEVKDVVAAALPTADKNKLLAGILPDYTLPELALFMFLELMLDVMDLDVNAA